MSSGKGLIWYVILSIPFDKQLQVSVYLCLSHHPAVKSEDQIYQKEYLNIPSGWSCCTFPGAGQLFVLECCSTQSWPKQDTSSSSWGKRELCFHQTQLARNLQSDVVLASGTCWYPGPQSELLWKQNLIRLFVFFRKTHCSKRSSEFYSAM